MVFAINPGDKFAAFQAAAKGNSSTSASTTAAATSTAAAASATASSSTDHKVTVGGPGQLVYNPSNITAQVGDTVTFQFMQKNHTVTASSFAAPCRALSQTSTTGQVGFDSGLYVK
jgi:plastocyanin